MNAFTHVLIQATAHSTMNPYHGQVLPLDLTRDGGGTGEYVLVEGVSTKVFAFNIAAYIGATAELTLEEATERVVRLANLPAPTLHVFADRVQRALEAPTGTALEAIADEVNRAIRKPRAQVGTLLLKSEAFPDANLEVLNAYYLPEGNAVRLFVAPLPRNGQESYWHQLQAGDAITEHTPEMALFQRRTRLARLAA